jgi:hypothetical protein
MKKSILTIAFLCASTIAFCQVKKATSLPAADSSLVIPKELAIKLFGTIQIAAKAIPGSSDIKAAEANYALPVLQEVYTLIVNKYQDKNAQETTKTSK